jgi:hypothetical protein
MKALWAADTQLDNCAILTLNVMPFALHVPRRRSGADGIECRGTWSPHSQVGEVIRKQLHLAGLMPPRMDRWPNVFAIPKQHQRVSDPVPRYPYRALWPRTPQAELVRLR